MFKYLILNVFSLILVLSACMNQTEVPLKHPDTRHNLSFSVLSDRWDEAIPLGNGMLGALVWHKDGKLRISLDRADLWDLRPVKEFDHPEFCYQWVYQQVLKKDGLFIFSVPARDRGTETHVKTHYNSVEIKELIEEYFVLDFLAIHQRVSWLGIGITK